MVSKRQDGQEACALGEGAWLAPLAPKPRLLHPLCPWPLVLPARFRPSVPATPRLTPQPQPRAEKRRQVVGRVEGETAVECLPPKDKLFTFHQLLFLTLKTIY